MSSLYEVIREEHVTPRREKSVGSSVEVMALSRRYASGDSGSTTADPAGIVRR
jgi:hypothetical protein